MALIELDEALRRVPPPMPLRVAWFEPGTLGAGRVWEPTQPQHLVLNVDASIIDLTSTLIPASYRAWEASRGLPADPWPPRGRVGAHLAWAAEQLLASPNLQVQQHLDVVGSVSRSEAGWCVLTANSSTTCGEVLLVTGHQGGAGPDHPHIMADLANAGPSHRVVVRGAALTAMDVVLDLTAGRGGTWVEESHTPEGLRYVASGREPRSIALWSRSGVLLQPKPERPDPQVKAAVRPHAARLASLHDPDHEWWGVVVAAARSAAATKGFDLATGDLFDALDQDDPCPDPWGRWRSDLHRSAGQVDQTPQWWLGRAWAHCYQEVTRSLERRPRHSATWPQWRRRAARLERWAFGPPSDTVRRLLVLESAGLLTLTRTRPSGEHHLIDAVTAGPGVLAGPAPWVGELEQRPESPNPLWEDLLVSGHAQVRPGERGAFTTAHGICVSAAGTESVGLAALGRPVEDPVIGHDTLQRSLHPDARRWAAALAARWTAGATGHHYVSSVVRHDAIEVP